MKRSGNGLFGKDCADSGCCPGNGDGRANACNEFNRTEMLLLLSGTPAIAGVLLLKEGFNDSLQ